MIITGDRQFGITVDDDAAITAVQEVEVPVTWEYIDWECESRLVRGELPGVAYDGTG